MSLSKLLSEVNELEVEGNEDLETKRGTNYIDKSGVYKTTITNAFVTKTKKGGLQCNVMFGGDNSIDMILYIASNTKAGLVTSCKMKGKTVSLPDYSLFKQLYFVATGAAKALDELQTEEKTIKYKSYGKDIEVDGEVIVDLIGKDVQIAIRLEEEYAYSDGETDKTSIKVDDNGNPRYKKSLMGVFSKKGKTPIEIIKKEEPTSIDNTIEFLNSDKAIKKVKLEKAEVESVEEDDELDF